MSEASCLYELVESRAELTQRFPDKQTAESFVNDVFHFLFVNDGKKMNYVQTEAEYKRLQSNLALLLAQTSRNEEEVETLTDAFFSELPYLYKTLLQDAQAILDFDPAAQSIA